jgi:hypothetical protein
MQLPYIASAEQEILKEITYATSHDRKEQFYERLEGWWLKKVIGHLIGSSDSPLSAIELELKLTSLREEFQKDNLPNDFFDYELNPDELSEEDKNFVEQLKLITKHSGKIRYAIQDYYRAFHQRSKWLRDGLVSTDELIRYQQS